MAYITLEKYQDYFGKPTLTEEEFAVYAGVASDIVDIVTNGKIAERGGIAAFPISIQTLIEKAVGAQIIYLSQEGMETVITGQAGAGYTVGKVHIDGNSAGAGASAAHSVASVMCLMYLERTGLLYRGLPAVYGGSIC